MKKIYIQPEVMETNITLASMTMVGLSDTIKVDDTPITDPDTPVYGSANERYPEWEEM